MRGARRDDLVDVVAVLRAVDVATLGEPDTTEADIASGWDEPSFQLECDAFVSVEEGRVTGYAEVYDRGVDRRELEVDVHVHPESWEPGVAAALLRRALARAEELCPLARVSTWLAPGDARVAVFAAEGFTARRSFVRMRRATSPVPQLALPRGVELSPPLPGVDERAVHRVLVASFATHVRPVPASYERFEQQHVHHPSYDPELWALAWHGDDAVGAITVFDHGDLGFIRHLGVLPAWRGRGVASALLTRTLAALAQRGQERVDLGVDVEDPVGALRLYEQLGFRTLQRLQLFERTP